MTTYLERFADAVHQLVGAQPPADMVHEWVDNIEVDGAHRLQHWVCDNLPTRLEWVQGIVLLDAATVLALTPEEGGEHADCPRHVRIEKLVEALRDAAAHLTGAASAYETYAKRHKSVGKAETDAFFTTRVADFHSAAQRARKALEEAT